MKPCEGCEFTGPAIPRWGTAWHTAHRYAHMTACTSLASEPFARTAKNLNDFITHAIKDGKP